MSEHEFEIYLSLLSRLVKLTPDQTAAIADELRDHLEEILVGLKLLKPEGPRNEYSARLAEALGLAQAARAAGSEGRHPKGATTEAGAKPTIAIQIVERFV